MRCQLTGGLCLTFLRSVSHAACLILCLYRKQRIIQRIGTIDRPCLAKITGMRIDHIGKAVVLLVGCRIRIGRRLEHRKPDHAVVNTDTIFTVI